MVRHSSIRTLIIPRLWTNEYDCRIPFERALDFANKEKITELLYPLFVHNIGAFLYHPTNAHRTGAVMAAAERRRADSNVLSQSQALNQGALQRRTPTDLIPSSQPPPLHHQGMHNPMHQHPNLSQPRPELQRSMSFPTPPSSASSVMGVGGSDSSFWSGNMQGGNGSLAIDTVMNSARSMPTTPATTPPGGIQQLQQYPPPPPSLYQSTQGNMAPQNIAQQNMQRFNQPLPQPSQYMNQNRDSSTMGPPTSRGPAPTLSRPSSRQDDHVKQDTEEQGGLAGEGEDHGVQEVHGEEATENEAEHVHEEEYTTHDSNYANGHRSNNVQYYPPLTTEPHLSPEMSGSPGQPSTPARSTYGAPNVNVPRTVDGGSTPRTTSTPQQWVQNSSGYSTPPRANSANGSAIRQPPARGAYQLANGDPIADHGEQTGTSVQDANYAVQSGLSGVPMPSQTPPQSFGGINGTGAATPSSNKRMREIDDDDEQGSRPSSRGHDGDADPVGGGMKRRKTIREGSTPSTGMGTSSFDRNSDGRLNRTRSAVVPGRVSGRRGA
jgi:protein SOK2